MNDCISREEAKKFLYERLDRLNNDELYDIFSTIIDDMYNELLPFNQSTGKWIPIKTKKGSVIAWKCSNCGNFPKHAIKSDFCPNCGIRMTLEDNNDNTN